MRIQPRQELLAAWKAIAKWSTVDDTWVWDGQHGRNSISDAELLLCLLRPPEQLTEVSFDRPDETRQDVHGALAALGNTIEIPRRMVRLAGEYLTRYTARSGTPVFGGGGYFVTASPEPAPEAPQPSSTAPPSSASDSVVPTAEQRKLEVVDSYATSVALMLAVIRFLRDYRPQAHRPAVLKEIDEVEQAASRRLTGAMVGLLRSFTLSVFRADTREGQVLCRTVSRRDEDDPTVVPRLREALRPVIAGLREPGLAAKQAEDLLENPDLLFECGWSWGVPRGAPAWPTTTLGEVHTPGFAEPAPYLYFTVVAMDGIARLLDPRAQIGGLLTEEQQGLARALSLRRELARRYWSTIASFGESRWPLEDIPWRTTDEDETDYYSLLVTSLVLDNLVSQRAPDTDLHRIYLILSELADRGRITRRPVGDDPALALHDPGALISLLGSETVEPGAPRLGWRLGDVATLLLGRTLAVARQVNDPELRNRLLALADNTWRHLDRRRLTGGRAAGLWDQPAQVFPALNLREEVPSWYLTTRAVQCLGATAELIQGAPPVSLRVGEVAADALIEAEHLFDRELLGGSGTGGPALRDTLRRQETTLRRARRLLSTRPATSLALASEVLRALDTLAAARESGPGD